jgi:phospholipase/carboxylesterase
VIFAERPAAGEPEGALVLIHGRGANEHDLMPLLSALDPEQRLHGYCPRGPLSMPPGGAHWYIVPRVGYPDTASFAEGFATLAGFVDSLPHERIVIGGFSQGAVMSYAVGLGRGRPRPTALIAFSGFIPDVDAWELDTEQPFPPIAIGHGTYDPIIPVEFAHRALATLEAAGATVLYRESPINHAIDPGFVAELRPWLRGALVVKHELERDDHQPESRGGTGEDDHDRALHRPEAG